VQHCQIFFDIFLALSLSISLPLAPSRSLSLPLAPSLGFSPEGETIRPNKHDLFMVVVKYLWIISSTLSQAECKTFDYTCAGLGTLAKFAWLTAFLDLDL
jgi:hypothetical protein